MRKHDELTKPSCMTSAHSEEMVFVLLSRDAAAPVAIRAWVQERLRIGKNTVHDAQIIEALECAATMEVERRKWADFQKAQKVEAAIQTLREECKKEPCGETGCGAIPTCRVLEIIKYL